MAPPERQNEPLIPAWGSSSAPRLLIIGAGSRGNAYARAVKESTNGIIVAVAEPVVFQRRNLGRKYIWGEDGPKEGQEFSGWKEYLDYEQQRRERAERGENVPDGVDGVFVCTLDTMHEEIIIALAPLNLHIMSEKPLATTLKSCLNIFRSLQPEGPARPPRKVFSIGHVLRYSPHNILLRKLVREERLLGDLLSIEHTEPVGWWHFSHSYVSAKKIYNERHLQQGITGWPVMIVVPDIENCIKKDGQLGAEAELMVRLGEDYHANTPVDEVDGRPWFGRCVYEADNDVCDDQFVTMTWEDDPLRPTADVDAAARLTGRGAKTATLHMIAFTESQCERRGRIYGTKGEIEYDSQVIRVHDFRTGRTKTHHPHQPGGGHGGGDDGLTKQYVSAIDAVKNQGMNVEGAQNTYIGCSLEEMIRSHAMVFAAEEARRDKQVVDWVEWWRHNVEEQL
ncbi:MAG: hypothetical protein M1830_003047 [Pleopsidium flavum]|nr:MAG: hypothetical protein M1830_003047 [Pleopsidium flavum]